MKKFVKKLRPGGIFRIGEHESWFTDMAAKGLFLESVGYRFAKFKRSEPKNVRYRLEFALDNKELPREQFEMYRECGWNYVTSYHESIALANNKFYVFSSPEELNAPEIHTDPVEQSFTLKYLNKKSFIDVLLVLATVILYFFLTFSTLFTDGTPYLALISYISPATLVLSILELYLVVNSIEGFLSVRSLKKHLSNGIPINHRANWRPHKVITNGFLIIYTVLGISSLFFFPKTVYLPIDDVSLPIVRLSEVENYQKKYDWVGSCISTSNVFLPAKYETHEKCRIFSDTSSNKTIGSDSNLSSQVYKVRPSFMADNLLYDLIKKETSTIDFSEKEYLYLEGDTTFEPLAIEDIIEIPNGDFDLLMVGEHEYGCKIFASRGKGVIYVSYFGDVDTEKIIDIISEKLSIIEK